MPYKLIIADDEPAAREGLQALLSTDAEVELVAICANGLQAIEAITSLHPDIVLLDIQMPEVNGFDVLRSIASPYPQVIFITAYDQYAIRAFEHHALDYLLKPFTDERFHSSLARAKKMVKQQQITDLSGKMLDVLNTPDGQESRLISALPTSKSMQKLVVKDAGKVVLVPWHDISYIQADDYVVRIYHTGKVLVIRESMRNLEKVLPTNVFIRTHKSYIVNLNKVQELHHDSPGNLVLTLIDKSKIPVSKTYKDRVVAKLGIA